MLGRWKHPGTVQPSYKIADLTSVEIDFPAGPPIHIEVTHPRVFYLIGFLLTSASKRDAMGRKPRRKIFALEGLKAWEKEITKSLDCMVPFLSASALLPMCRSFMVDYFRPRSDTDTSSEDQGRHFM